MRRLPLLAALFLIPAATGSSKATPCIGLGGSFAYVKSGALHVLDFPSCRDRVLVARGAQPPVRFSADGRYLAFSGGVVPNAGGRVVAGSGVWAPRGHLLATTTKGGGVVVGGRRILRDAWGAVSILWTRQGNLLIARSRFPRMPYRQEIWLWVARAGNLRRVAGPFRGLQTPELATASPDGKWLFWWPRWQNSNSLAADGMPLEAKRTEAGTFGLRVVRSMLLYPDFLGWCGNHLVVAGGSDRYATHGKMLFASSAALWRRRDLSRDRSRSWVSPACSPDGKTIAAAAGRDSLGQRFGREHRSIWLLSLDGQRRRLTAPSTGATDELPRFARDGRSIVFVRSSFTNRNANATGSLHVVRLDGSVSGPLARLGTTGNYYGHYGWVWDTDWHR